jgi:hypothetical protein
MSNLHELFVKYNKQVYFDFICQITKSYPYKNTKEFNSLEFIYYHTLTEYTLCNLSKQTASIYNLKQTINEERFTPGKISGSQS